MSSTRTGSELVAELSVDPPVKGCETVSIKCTSLALRKAARAASQFLEIHLQPLGLHSSQFGILSNVSKAGSITMTKLSDEMSLDRTTLTRNLQILERDGLVEVVAGSDRRVRRVALTGKGCSVLTQAIPLWEESEKALSRLLGEDQRRAMLAIAGAITAVEDK